MSEMALEELSIEECSECKITREASEGAWDRIALEKRIAELEADRAPLIERCQDVAKLSSFAMEIKDRKIEELHKALAKYGRHLRNCRKLKAPFYRMSDCTCGRESGPMYKPDSKPKSQR